MSNIISRYATKEDHEKFLSLFSNKLDFQFHPEKCIFDHYLKLKNNFYTKDCMIGWLEHTDVPLKFTKKEFYTSIGFAKPNEAFNKFWNFLTAPRQTGHYLAYDTETKKWTTLN